MTYSLQDAARDSARALRTHRRRQRLYRWISHPLFRPAVFAWAIITLPIKAVMFARTAPTIFAAFTATALVTVAYA